MAARAAVGAAQAAATAGSCAAAEVEVAVSAGDADVEPEATGGSPLPVLDAVISGVRTRVVRSDDGVEFVVNDSSEGDY